MLTCTIFGNPSCTRVGIRCLLSPSQYLGYLSKPSLLLNISHQGTNFPESCAFYHHHLLHSKRSTQTCYRTLSRSFVSSILNWGPSVKTGLGVWIRINGTVLFTVKKKTDLIPRITTWGGKPRTHIAHDFLPLANLLRTNKTAAAQSQNFRLRSC